MLIDSFRLFLVITTDGLSSSAKFPQQVTKEQVDSIL